MSSRVAFFAVTASLLVFSSPHVSGTEWFVDGAVAESGDGQTSETAFKTIQEGIDAASDGDTISVLPGHYVETFTIRKSLSLIGSGFDVTVIDADGKPGAIAMIAPRYKDWDSKDPSYDRERKPFSIEGFTIMNSAADGLGAIHCFHGDLTLKDCKITGNSGKFGAALFLEESSAEITGCEMSENSAEEAGGAIYAWASEVILRDCVIHKNAAENPGSPGVLAGEGGGVACWYSPVRMVRTLVAGNSAARGGGIFCEECPVILVNCTVADNSATEGAGGIHCETAAPRQALPLLANCIVWGNGLSFSAPLGPEVSYSDIEDAKFAGNEGNISQPPLFADPSEGDYSLQGTSPCIGAGNPHKVFNDDDGSRCDMGAYGGTGLMGQIGLEPRAAHATTEADSEGRRSLVVYWLAEPSASFRLQWKEDVERVWWPGVSVEANETCLHRWLHEYGMDFNRRFFYRVGR